MMISMKIEFEGMHYHESSIRNDQKAGLRNEHMDMVNEMVMALL